VDNKSVVVFSAQ